MTYYIIDGMSYDRCFDSLKDARQWVKETIKADNFYATLLKGCWGNGRGKIARVTDTSVKYFSAR